MQSWQRLWNTEKSYFVALFLTAVFVVGSSLYISNWVLADDAHGYIINASGKQRMLSQRLDLFAQRLILSESDRTEIAAEIDLMLEEFLTAHAHLTNLESIEGRKALPLSADSHDLYFSPPHELDRRVQIYAVSIGDLLSSAGRDQTHLRSLGQDVHELAQDLLPRLDLAVQLFEKNYRNESNQARWVIAWVTLLMIMIVGTFWIFVLRPLIRQKQELAKNLEKSKNELQRSRRTRDSFIANTSQELDVLSRNLLNELNELWTAISSKELQSKVEKARFLVEGLPNLSEHYRFLDRLKHQNLEIETTELSINEIIRSEFMGNHWSLELAQELNSTSIAEKDAITEILIFLKKDLLGCETDKPVHIKSTLLVENDNELEVQLRFQLEGYNFQRVFNPKILSDPELDEDTDSVSHGLGRNIYSAQHICQKIDARLECMHPSASSFAIYLVLNTKKQRGLKVA